MRRRYFGVTTGANILLLGHMLMASQGAMTSPVVNLGAAALASSLNWLWLEPKCTKLMFSR